MVFNGVGIGFWFVLVTFSKCTSGGALRDFYFHTLFLSGHFILVKHYGNIIKAKAEVKTKMNERIKDYLKDSEAIDYFDFNSSLFVGLESLIKHFELLLPESEKVEDIFINFSFDEIQGKNQFETLFLFSKNYFGETSGFSKPKNDLIKLYPLKNKIDFVEVLLHRGEFKEINVLLTSKKEITIKAESSNCKCLKNIYNLYLKNNLAL